MEVRAVPLIERSEVFTMPKVERFQIGNRWVEKGHVVTVLPSAGGKRDGFEAKVIFGVTDDEGHLREVTVHGARGKKAPATRSFRPERLRAKRQPKEVRGK